MFKCYNLMDPMEQRAINFFNWYPIRQLQDIMIIFLSLYIIVFVKNDFSN